MNLAKQLERFGEAYEKALACKWKGYPASVTKHLRKRKKRGHLSEDATETDLIRKGLEVLTSPDSIVYEYIPSSTRYFVVNNEWAVFFDENGLWDTAFPPDIPERYFSPNNGYRLLGKLSNVITT